MELRFGPGDEDAYLAARAELSGRFSKSLANRESADASDWAEHVNLALDYKWACDGDLLCWSEDEVRDFFVEWLPSVTDISPERGSAIVAATGSFLSFLDHEGLLSLRGDSPAALISALDQHGAELVTRARQPTGRHPASVAPAELPARGRPPSDAMASAAAEAPVLNRFSALGEFVGAGRPLTAKGNLRLADARALVSLLDTGDDLEYEIDGKVFTIRSAVQLRRLDLILRWARQAGVVRTDGGRLVANSSWAVAVRDSQVAVWRAFDALQAIGLLRSQRRGGVDSLFDAITLAMENAVPQLLGLLYAADTKLPYDEVVARAVELVQSGVVLPDWCGAQLLEEFLRRDLSDILVVLGDAGMVVRHGAERRRDRVGMACLVGGTVELTTLGIALVQRWLPSLGFVVPVVDTFDISASDEPAQLLDALAELLCTGGPPAMLEAFDTLGDADAQKRLLGSLLTLPSNPLLPVLDAIGRHHLTSTVATAARMAARQHRSRLDNR